MKPLRKEVIQSTWMHERIGCDGKQQLFRTSNYFEYPSVTSMLIRVVKYGIKIGVLGVSIEPFYDQGADVSFRWAFGNVNVTFSVDEVSMNFPRGLNAEDTRMTAFVLGRLKPNTIYAIYNDCENKGGLSTVTSDEFGRIRFQQIAGTQCVVKAKRVK